MYTSSLWNVFLLFFLLVPGLVLDHYGYWVSDLQLNILFWYPSKELRWAILSRAKELGDMTNNHSWEVWHKKIKLGHIKSDSQLIRFFWNFCFLRRSQKLTKTFPNNPTNILISFEISTERNPAQYSLSPAATPDGFKKW